MRTKMTISVLVCIITSLNAQHALEKELNAMRHGDKITKQLVEYKDPGRSGENVLWDFSTLKDIQPKYTLKYKAYDPESPEKLVGIEHNTMYYYQESGDSIQCAGYENPLVTLRYNQPELTLQFPFPYATSINDTITGLGSYCELQQLAMKATNKSTIDAWGMIILPNQDTLKNVIRHTITKEIQEVYTPLIDTLPRNEKTDSLLLFTNGDSLKLKTQTHRWYAHGYRYPVFETFKYSYLTAQGEIEYSKLSFFFNPDDHAYLEHDPANREILEAYQAAADSAGHTSPGNPGNPNDPFRYNIYPNPVQSRLNIEYYLPVESSVKISMYDAAGTLIHIVTDKVEATGVYHTHYDMDTLPAGTYLLLIRYGENKKSELIIKK